jgi:type I restriction enzyme S subunit
MKKYSSYRPSGVDWIGDIPENWNTLKLKHEYKIQKGRIPKTISEKMDEGLVPYLSMEVLRGSDTSSFVSNDDGVFVNEGQTLILWDGSNSGEIIKVEKDGILSSTMGVLNKIGNKLNEDFSFYQLKSHEREIRNNTNGMGIPHVDGQYVRSLVLLTPPLQEQEQIVKYLDGKTIIIDKLISTKQRKVELLKEQRNTLINQVITKGLNPKVKMKDSGVEWIGEIPESWWICKLKLITSLITDGSHFSPIIENEGKYYISVSDITKINEINFEDCKKISQSSFDELEKNGCRPKTRDILITKDGTIGRGCIVGDFNDFVILSSLGLIRLNENQNENYILYYLLSQMNINQMYSHIRGSGITRLTIKLIKDLLIVVPSLEEQEQIVQYLDKHTKEIDDLVSMEQNKIELLKEYKQSLISEIITGKIMVI